MTCKCTQRTDYLDGSLGRPDAGLTELIPCEDVTVVPSFPPPRVSTELIPCEDVTVVPSFPPPRVSTEARIGVVAGRP